MRRKIHGDEGDVRTEKCQGRLTVYFEDPFWVMDYVVIAGLVIAALSAKDG